MSVLVKYSDIALGAKEAFEINTSNELSVSNIDLIKTDDAFIERYDIPFDLNSMILDGESNFLPEDSVANIGYISNEISNENGDFLNPIEFEFVAIEKYICSGITLLFDEKKNIYSSHINIKWYNDQVLLSSRDFFPTSANYFCENKVEFYNRIVIIFYSLNVPKNRLIVNGMEHGLKAEFLGNELKSAHITQEIDLISQTIPISFFDFTLDSKKNINYTFQIRQPIEVIFNGQTKAKTFVKRAKRKSKTTWDVESEDYIGILDSTIFKGGMFVEKNVVEILGDIFETAKVPFIISDEWNYHWVTGYIPYTSCREALQQVLFAIGAVVDTSDSVEVNVVSLTDEVSQTISKRRIMQEQTFEENTRITAVEVTSHSYTETSEVVEVYNAEKSGSGQNILITFSEPFCNLEITDGSTIIESGANYAIIDANSTCKLMGYKYKHTTIVYRKSNPFVVPTDTENIVSVKDATLVSSYNIDNVLERCYNYFAKEEKAKMKIIEGNKMQKTKVGDLVIFETDYLGNKTGRIIKQNYNLVGNILVKNSEVV